MCTILTVCRGVLRLRNLHSHAVGQLLDSLRKAQAQVFNQKANSGPVGPASKAVIKLLGGAHRKRGRLFCVEGAKTGEIRAGLLELDVGANHFHDVDSLKQGIEEGLGDHPTILKTSPMDCRAMDCRARDCSGLLVRAPQSLGGGHERNLILASGKHLAANALVMAFHGSRLLALALGSGLLIELTGAKLVEEANLFNGALKAPHGGLEGLIFF